MLLTKIDVPLSSLSLDSVKMAILHGEVVPYIPPNFFRWYYNMLQFFRWYFYPFMYYYQFKYGIEKVISRLAMGNVKIYSNWDPVIYNIANFFLIPISLNRIRREWEAGLQLMVFEWSRGPFYFSWYRDWETRKAHVEFLFKKEF